MSRVPSHLDDGQWFHGSPERFDVLAPGSTVTRCRAVAEAFAHRPTWVGIEEGPSGVRVSHNGRRSGHLYVVEEPVTESDLHPHPDSSHPGGGLEWITDRSLRVRQVAELPLPDAPEEGGP